MSMQTRRHHDELEVGRSYSNGVFGRNWQVRQILALDDREVTYKVLVGPDRRKRASCSRSEFQGWIGYEVVRDENSWVRKG